MKFPCQNCVVDVMCIEACSNLKEYLSLVYHLDRGYTITAARLKRLSSLASTSIFYRSHYANAYKRYRENKNGASMRKLFN